ncbi:MAG: AhpC/TSA family protein [Bacteroidaceae bacterium]|nr:AhpC/TSA family protein [Bacteroidaceae bacterium]
MKTLKYLGLTLMLGACTSPQPKDYYEIVGEVKNVEDSTIINLFRRDGDVGRTIATDTIIGGKFYFKIKPDSLMKDELSLGCHRSKQFPSMSATLWASAGDYVKVTGENTLIHIWEVKGGAPENATWQAYLNDSRELWEEYQRNSVLQKELSTQARSLPKEERDALKLKYDSLESINDKLMIQIGANEIQRMKKTEVDVIWMDKLRGLALSVKYTKDYPYKEETIALYNSLTEEQKQDRLAQEAYVMLFPPQHVEVGKEMADTDLFDLQGNKHRLADLKGKYILIDFWSSGCGPCIMAIPEMGELAPTYKDKLNIVSISTDNKNVWERASKEHPMTWNNWNDMKGQAGIYAQYDQGGIPNYTLISPEGIVLEQWTGYGKGSLKAKIGEYLNK